tara:strand:- start:420 stop:689 length:270 start_codon:yes stop_codon:yes gene_type:complete
MDQNTSISNKRAISPYSKLACLNIRALMAKKEVRYADLSSKLLSKGVVISPNNLRNKISTLSLSAGLFILIISILTNEDHVEVSLKDLK